TEGFSFSSVKVLNIDEKSGVTKIGDSAFNNDNAAPSPRNLTTANLGSVQTVGIASFYGTDLESIKMANVTVVGYCAFATCRNLSHVELPAVKVIAELAFSYCDKLSSIDLSNVTCLGEHPFAGVGTCTSDKTFTIYYGTDTTQTSEEI